jgi:Tol biopolymer transport system component
MSVTAPPRPPRPSDPVDRDELEALVNALIEEARRRARRRRLLYAAAAASIALAGVVIFTVFDHTAQSQTASPATAARTGLAAAAQSRIAFITAVPRAKLPKGYGWLAEVNVMNADGSGKRTLTRTAWNFQPPAWSPDGKQVAFERRLDPTRWKGQCGGCDVEVYVMNADGSGQRNLTRSPATEDSGPAWSPDGRKIAFGRGVAQTSRLGGIWLMNADGSGQQRIADSGGGPPASPVWSPDGQKIAFAGRRDRTFASNPDRDLEIYVMDADGSAEQKLTHNQIPDANPVWSPDSRTIAFTRSGMDSGGRYVGVDLYLIDADGSGERHVIGVSPSDTTTAWSPDGQRIAFVSHRDGNDEVYVVEADGTGLRNLTRNPSRDGHPVWSPDGKTIGFVANRGGNRDIYVMNADGSSQRNLTRDIAQQAFGIAWAPAQTR